MAALAVALVLALTPEPPPNSGAWRIASISAFAALLVAAWVAITLVPIPGPPHPAALARLQNRLQSYRSAIELFPIIGRINHSRKNSTLL